MSLTSQYITDALDQLIIAENSDDVDDKTSHATAGVGYALTAVAREFQRYNDHQEKLHPELKHDSPGI